MINPSKKKETWLTAYAERHDHVPHRIMPKFDFKQYARALKKAEKLVGREEALRRWRLFCWYSDYS